MYDFFIFFLIIMDLELLYIVVFVFLSSIFKSFFVFFLKVCMIFLYVVRLIFLVVFMIVIYLRKVFFMWFVIFEFRVSIGGLICFLLVLVGVGFGCVGGLVILEKNFFMVVFCLFELWVVVGSRVLRKVLKIFRWFFDCIWFFGYLVLFCLVLLVVVFCWVCLDLFWVVGVEGFVVYVVSFLGVLRKFRVFFLFL